MIWLLACPVPVGPFSFVVVAIIWERPGPWFVQAYKGSVLFRPSQICKYLQVLHIIDSGQIGVMTSAVFLRIRPSSCLVNEVVLSDVQGECGAAQSCWQYSVGLARQKLVEYWQWCYISHLRVPAQWTFHRTWSVASVSKRTCKENVSNSLRQKCMKWLLEWNSPAVEKTADFSFRMTEGRSLSRLLKQGNINIQNRWCAVYLGVSGLCRLYSYSKKSVCATLFRNYINQQKGKQNREGVFYIIFI